MIAKLIHSLTKKETAEPKASDFSRFFHSASSREKKRVYMDVARKASADQRKVLERATPHTARP